MTQKDFWRSSTIAVLGAGSWGSVLAQLGASNCREVRLWARTEEHARAINSTRANPPYVPEDFRLNERVRVLSALERVFEGGVGAILWALPSEATREQARRIAPFVRGEEILIHATKGIEAGTMKRISEVLREEIACPRIGVLSGPNLSFEVARGEPAATVIASPFEEVVDAGVELLTTEHFRVFRGSDLVGVEWAGALKNILAIAAGALDEMKLGWNARAMLITRGLEEMVRFGSAMGARESSFLGLAGIGDLLATASSPLSRNHRVGVRLARGERLGEILEELGATAEGVRTTEIVWKHASANGIPMPITEGVHRILEGVGRVPVESILTRLMSGEARG
jgi:glycerol-3-phosphate dehydrogenase (NAD(P)+)